MKRTAKDDFQPFLAEAYAKGVPEPGACLKLFYNSGLNVSVLLSLNYSINIDYCYPLPSPKNSNSDAKFSLYLALL